MDKTTNKKKSLATVLFALSFWLIFVTIEGSFSVQMFLPFLLLIILYKVIICKKFKIKINTESKTLFWFIAALINSTAINAITHNSYFSVNTLIGIAYFIVIYLWYLFNTNKVYDKLEIKYIISSYIGMSVLCSIMLIRRFLGGQLGKIAMINFINVEIDENYVSALIAMASLFLFSIILNNDSNTKISVKILRIIFLGINILAIALSGSRAALIGTILCIILSYMLALKSNLTRKKLIKLLVICFLVIGIGGKVLNYLPAWTFNRYFNSSYSDNSNSRRVLMWKNGINGFFYSPFYGYSIRIFDQLPNFSNIDGFQIPERVPAHQTYIDILLYTGIFGFIPFILFICKILKKIITKEEKRMLPMVLFLLFITNIIGAEKSVLMWNNLILFTIIGDYIEKNENINDIYKEF